MLLLLHDASVLVNSGKVERVFSLRDRRALPLWWLIACAIEALNSDSFYRFELLVGQLAIGFARRCDLGKRGHNSASAVRVLSVALAVHVDGGDGPAFGTSDGNISHGPSLSAATRL